MYIYIMREGLKLILSFVYFHGVFKFSELKYTLDIWSKY